MTNQHGEEQEHQFQDHVVRIVVRERHDELWIDGTRRKYFVTDDGFTLHDDAYAPPQKTLLEAVKCYCERPSQENP